PNGKIEDGVREVAFADGQWYAATSSGVYTSGDSGFAWKGGPIEKNDAFTGIAAAGNTVLASGARTLYMSRDQAKTWQPVALPTGWTRVRYVAVDPDGGFWLGGRMGVAYSTNQGQSWQLSGVPINNISGLAYDAGIKRVIATSYDSDLVFGINPAAKNWIWWNPGWRTHAVESSNGRLVAATLLHGMIVEPEKQVSSSGH
ncbi:MAG: transcriptional regulator, partial [Acidobacteriaceae bacterium]